MPCLINLFSKFFTTRATCRAFALISALPGVAHKVAEITLCVLFLSFSPFLLHLSPPPFKRSTPPSHFPSGDAPQLAPAPHHAPVSPLQAPAAVGQPQRLGGNFPLLQPTGMGDFTQLNWQTQLGLGGLFHSVCCFTLNPNFHLLYFRGGFWRALLPGELLQSVSTVLQAL